MKQKQNLYFLIAGIAAVTLAMLTYFILRKTLAPTIKVGILHSLTGTMLISESNVIAATQMAIDEINAAGGVLGRQIESVLEDGQSNATQFALHAEKLITKERVVAIFGCWTSASRKEVKPVVEKHHSLLFYPVQYEGLEQSPNIIYTGAAPNQQIIPGVSWCFRNLGKRFFLVGSDYIYPRTANAIIKKLVTLLGGEIAHELYIPLGSDQVDEAIAAIKETSPTVILNTINGSTNIAFFKKLREEGITPEKIPTMSFSISEPEFKSLGVEHFIGDYATWNYFQTIDSSENDRFTTAFRHRYGADRAIGDPMEAAYFGVHLWAQAVNAAQSTDIEKVKQALKNQNFNAPEGIVYIDEENNHTWKTVRIGKVRADGKFNIIWDSEKAMRPLPYPFYEDTTVWEQFLQDLFTRWGGKWAYER